MSSSEYSSVGRSEYALNESKNRFCSRTNRVHWRPFIGNRLAFDNMFFLPESLQTAGMGAGTGHLCCFQAGTFAESCVGAVAIFWFEFMAFKKA
jgi:hypothetical protein